MPTGYTADVVDGKITDLKPFVLQCARAFGACVSMRDEPWSTPIPERFERSQYHAEKLIELRADRDTVMAMDEGAADFAAQAYYLREQQSYDDRQSSKARQRERYEAMIAKVEAYHCPHSELKAFMLEQLRSGLDFDCPPPSDAPWNQPPEPKTGTVWRSERLEKLEQGILYHAAEHAKEVERTESRNIWMAALRASLEDEI